jgi:GNAT superfamily N-acetyltransferase
VPVREMNAGDLDLAVELINREGWGHTRIDLERILSLSPGSNFVWEASGVARGFVTSVVYESTAMVAHVLVSEESRGRLIGKSLLKTLLDRMDSDGIRSVILFATEAGSQLYQKFGFETTNEILSVGLYVQERVMRSLPQTCHRVEADDLGEISAMDALTFGDNRPGLMTRLHRDFPEHCFKVVRDGRVDGFIFGRRTPIGYDIGPWISMAGDEKDARSLLSSVIASFPGGGRVDLSQFSDHSAAARVLSRYHHYKKAESVRLMVRGEHRYVKNRDEVFGLAGFDLG